MTGVVLAEMSAADLAMVVVTGSIAAVVAVLFALQRSSSPCGGHPRSTTQRPGAPLIEELALAEANEELARVDRLVGSAESISATVDATSKLAYRALSAPVIKTVAITSGASRAAKRLRKE